MFVRLVALLGLAWLWTRTGRHREALPFATPAVQLAPSQAPALDTLADVLVGLEDCVQGLAFEEQALAVLPDNVAPQTRKEYEENLGNLRKRCAAPGR